MDKKQLEQKSLKELWKLQDEADKNGDEELSFLIDDIIFDRCLE